MSQSSLKMKVAVIGAGPAGLCALKHMLCHHTKAFDPVAFERGEQIGGQWVHSSDTTKRPLQSAIYDNMRCNIPKELMGYPGFPFPEDVPAYVHHSNFLKYLESYADHFALNSCIKLNTEVTQVIPLLDSSNCPADGTAWKVTSKNLLTGDIEQSCFDAVLICNGHYTVPHYNINGLSNFKGTVMHSQTYRNAKPFHSRSVLVVGSSLSGIDIAMEVASVASRVYLSQRRRAFVIKGDVSKNIIPVSCTLRIQEDGTVVLKDGSTLQVDTLLLCTGYEYDFPFLTKECGITVENNRVQPLYKQIFNTRHPTMAFISINSKVLPLFNMDVQVRATVAILSGDSQLPDTDAMLEDEEKDYKERILDAGLLPSDTHDIDKIQWPFYATLADMGGFERFDPIYEEIYHHVGAMRVNDVAEYKNYKCVVDWDKRSFKFIREIE